MATRTRIQELFDKYLQQRCTPAEMEELVHLLQDLEAGEMLTPRMLELWEQIRKEQKIYPVDWAGMYKTVTQHSSRKRANRSIGKKIIYRAAAAVGAILIISVAWYAWRHTSEAMKVSSVAAVQAQPNDVLPGGNKAVLTLANGTTVILDQAANGTLATQGSSQVIKLDSGELAYQPTDGHTSQAETQYNTLTTPRGGQYRLQLPDGTEVWLNAASSIHYPTAFTGKSREVEITGEVYFEVAHNASQPFLVTAGNMKVKVLGTHFNINAYADETTVKTTLLEGKVEIGSVASRQQPFIITPGQQVLLNRSGQMKLVKHADVEEEVAWKNGLFLFHNDDIQSVMRKLSRWYDVQVEYKGGNVPESHFTGAIQRQENISKVLKMLELTGGARFDIEGKKIVVSY